MKTKIIFFALFVFLSWFYGLFDTMDRGPYSQHQWRQVDCLSITENYYQNNLPFLEPEMHWQGEGESGKAISEFPILYYSVGKMWQLFGKHYWIYRLLNYLIIALGLYYLYKLTLLLITTKFWAVFIPLFLFTSPVLVYYSNNFLLNSTSLALVLIASYHFYRHYTERSFKHLIFSCLIFLLAGLLKITALLIFFGFGAIFIFEVFWKEKSCSTRWKEFLPYIFTLLGIFLWYRYAAHYNATNMSGVFRQGIGPIWELDSDQIALVWNLFQHDVLPEFFNVSVLFLIIALLLILLLNFKRLHSYLRALLILTTIGIISYFLLFYQVFSIHEYYLINVLIFIPIVLLCTLDYMKTHFPDLYASKTLKILAVTVLLITAYYSRIKTIIKYDVGSAWVRTSMHTSQENKEMWQLYHWNYLHTYKDLETIDPYLTEIGVGRNDRVISMPDSSVNISLYLMNRKGFNNYGYPQISGVARVEKAKEWGAKYLIINNMEFLEKVYLEPYLKDKIGKTEYVSIYRLSD